MLASMQLFHSQHLDTYTSREQVLQIKREITEADDTAVLAVSPCLLFNDVVRQASVTLSGESHALTYVCTWSSTGVSMHIQLYD